MGRPAPQSILEFGRELKNQTFDESTFSRMYEWRRYVPDGLKKCWAELSDEARVVLFYTAKDRAHQENWDE